ncbi:hypothetical protein ACUR5C_00415 [Aliikangiella sp. IMCC44653]
MKIVLPLPPDKKLNVIYRLEPGCMGPDGIDSIEQFCNFAQQEVAGLDADFVHWEILPRFDKSLDEMEYRVAQKRLTHDQAAVYLNLFSKQLDEFEEHLHERIGELIEAFLGR